MATDQERLLVVIEARLRQFERAMQQATGGADRAAGRIERRFRSMERNLSGIGAGFGRTLLASVAAFASARGLVEAADSFTRIQNALSVAGLEGEEMTAVFNRLFSAAQKNAAPIESLTELYSRAALVQKELGISTEELLRFTEGVSAALRVSGKSAQESSGALLQLAQALGSGVVRAEEFNSILEGALPIAQAAARGLTEAGGSVAKLRQLVIEGKVSSEAFFRAFEAGQGSLEDLAEVTDITLGGAMTRLRNTFTAVIGGMNETTGTSRALIAGLTGLSDTLETTGKAADYLAGKWDDLAESAERAFGRQTWEQFKRVMFDLDLGLGELTKTTEEAIGNFDAIEAAKEAIRQSGPVTDEDLIAGPRIEEAFEDAATGAETAAARISRAFEVASSSAVRPVSLEDFTAPASRGTKKTPEQKFTDDIARIRERTEALRVEASVIGESTFAQEKALAVLNLTNEAKRTGLTITPDLTAKIEAEATAYANAAEKLELVEQRYEDMQALQQFFAEGLTDTLSDIVTGAATAEEALRRLVEQLIRAVLQAALLGQGPLAALVGGSGSGGFLGHLLGGARASGGPVSPGKVYRVGERGPELFSPSVAGRIIPNGGSGQMSITVSVAGARGDREIEAHARAGMMQALAEYDRTIPGRVRSEVGSMAVSGNFRNVGIGLMPRRT